MHFALCTDIEEALSRIEIIALPSNARENPSASGAGTGAGAVREAVRERERDQEANTDSNTAAARLNLSVKLQQFNLDDAHCYDPNEERKIKQAIAAGPGAVRGFERTMHEVGLHLASQQQQ